MFTPGVLLHSEGRRHRTGMLPSAVRTARAHEEGRARSALIAARALASAPRPPLGGPLGGPLDQARLAAALTRLAALPVPV
jgi:hypothetical protein